MHLRTPSVAVGAAKVRQLARDRVLDVRVLAPAALEEQPDLDLAAIPLVEVNHRGAGAEVVAGVLPRDRVDGVRPELARASSAIASGSGPYPDLVGADRRLIWVASCLAMASPVAAW
jgi:hypothetical protein